MFAKLFARVTESSLMEETIPTRYVFVMLLAIADPHGYVIGTDVAIARRLNIPLPDFQKAMSVLMSPDPDSNSKAEEGRRVVASDGERGYRLVNFIAYRNIKDEDERRAYHRDYQARYRAEGRDKSRPVNSGKLGKEMSSGLRQEEGEVEGEVREVSVPPSSDYKRDSATRIKRNDQINELTRQIHRIEDKVSTDEERQAHPELVKQLKALKAKRDALREEVVR